MKRFLTAFILVMTILIAGGYFLYKQLVPGIIAGAVVSDSLPGYIPKRIQVKMEAIRKPINKGTEALVVEMHDSNIPLQDVLKTVDNITEEQAYQFLDHLNAAKPTSTNEVFDVAKEHFDTPFDMEVFRQPFNEHFEMNQIRKALVYANLNRKSNDVDMATAKAIFKKILLEKEKEVLKKRSLSD